MTERPTRATTSGRAYLDLRKLAKAQGRPTAELLQLYALEGFLTRLPMSSHADQLILKGGLLMAAFDARRPTRDIDLTARQLSSDSETVRAAIIDVLSVEVDDGLEFDPPSIQARVIREDDDYSGVRVTVPCRLASAVLDFHVDVTVGDPIRPPPTSTSVPRLLGGDPLTVTAYPIAMVLAEKLVTVVQRGTANTRWRDFVDIAELTRRHALEDVDLRQAIEHVARHRQATLHSLHSILSGFAVLAQPRWAAWRRKQRLEDRTPERFEDLLTEVITFAEPLLVPGDHDRSWNPDLGTWK